jgi:hypothetical protein
MPKTKAETAVLDTFKEEDLAVIEERFEATVDEELNYFKDLADRK